MMPPHSFVADISGIVADPYDAVHPFKIMSLLFSFEFMSEVTNYFVPYCEYWRCGGQLCRAQQC